ncbi:MAG: type II secretion system protein [Candidatus Omnitrophica bacterium]|nr:type II secretion system protein [Candidatus Omnitrophota bacterium]
MAFKKGFTLTELITVVIIIGILSVIAVPQFFRISERAKAAEAVAILSAIRSAQLRYAVDADLTTDDLSELDIDIPSLKYFEPPTPVEVDPRASPTAILCRVRRLPGVSNPGFSAYSLNIDSEGTIGCTGGNLNVCSMLGYIIRN